MPRRRAALAGRVLPLLLTVGIFLLILERIPYRKLLAALGEADHAPFLALMVVNAVFYFSWDTLVLTVVIRSFHGPVAYRDLLAVRAASYVVAVFNTNAARGALAAFLSRRLQAPFLQIGSTVIFLLLTEYMHLVIWATLGILSFPSALTRRLWWVPPSVAALWLIFLLYARLEVRPWRAARWLARPREWSIFRTFRLAAPRRYVQIVLLRAPMLFVSLVLHYFAVKTFGIAIPFGEMLAFLPVIFMVAALPITVAHLGTTQAAWILFFGSHASAPRLLAFSLAAHLAFVSMRALLGLAFLPRAYGELLGEGARAKVRPPLTATIRGE